MLTDLITQLTALKKRLHTSKIKITNPKRDVKVIKLKTQN